LEAVSFREVLGVVVGGCDTVSPCKLRKYTSIMNVLTRLAAISCLCLLGQTLLWGDVTANISGVVKDPSGALIPGVTVTALHTETGIKVEVQTNAEGFYEFLSLPVGHYDIEAQQQGF
jgi:hypothetical protein